MSTRNLNLDKSVAKLRSKNIFNGVKSKVLPGSSEDQKIIEVLMGDEVAPRKDFITNTALDVVNLDI